MCTGIRFADNSGNMYFGRNLDWSVGYGQEVLVTKKPFVLESAFLGKIPAKDTEEENVARLFHTLAGVAMIDGAARMHA